MACAADAPKNLRSLMRDMSVDHAQSLGRYSLRERFMWAGSWSDRVRQVAGEHVEADQYGRDEHTGYKRVFQCGDGTVVCAK